MKIPFDIKYRPQIESGEYKVETGTGKKVRIICWDKKSDKNKKKIVALLDDGNSEHTEYFTEKGTVYDKATAGGDLFIITPEPELSEFEDKLRIICENAVKEAYLSPGRTSEEFAKNHAAELLSLARDQFIKDGYVIEKKAFQDAVEKVDPEVMKGVSDKVDMEEDLRLEYERGKAEALKNLPRWREWGNGAAGNSDGHPIALVSGDGGIRFVSVLGITGEKYIMLDDLKKLPGFKED